MEPSKDAIKTLQTLVIALGAGLAAWGTVQMMKGIEEGAPELKARGAAQVKCGAALAGIACRTPTAIAAALPQPLS